MPTPRYFLSVISTESSIIACGGFNGTENCATVEVYSDQWYEADSLPCNCALMTSVNIDDTCYLLGGNCTPHIPTKTAFYAAVPTLIEKAMSTSRGFLSRIRSPSAWKTLPNTPMKWSTAASLGGHLLAVGGFDDEKSPAVHMFIPQTNRWVRMTFSDLPVPLDRGTAIELPNNTLLVCGGHVTDIKRIKTVYMGSITTK